MPGYLRPEAFRVTPLGRVRGVIRFNPRPFESDRRTARHRTFAVFKRVPQSIPSGRA
jgi:hypothetical protein